MKPAPSTSHPDGLKSPPLKFLDRSPASRYATAMQADHLKFVQWSEADGLFVGYCPHFFIGGICHGTEEQKVYRELSRLVAAEITEIQQARRVEPKKSALVSIRVLI